MANNLFQTRQGLRVGDSDLYLTRGNALTLKQGPIVKSHHDGYQLPDSEGKVGQVLSILTAAAPNSPARLVFSDRVSNLESRVDSESQRVSQIREDIHSRLDSDSKALGEVRRDLDSDHLLFAGQIKSLQDDRDSDTIQIQLLSNRIDSEIAKISARMDSDAASMGGFDSDIRSLSDKVFRLQQDRDSEQTQLQHLSNRIDSELGKIFDLLDSDTQVLQSLAGQYDSLTTKFNNLNNDVDSDMLVMEALRQRTDSDANTLNVFLNERYDSDFANIQTKINSLQSDRDSDSIRLQSSVTDIINRLDSETARVSGIAADLDSDFGHFETKITETDANALAYSIAFS